MCPTMANYLKKVHELLLDFEKLKLKQLQKEENNNADALTNIASVVHLIGKMAIPLEFLFE